MILAYKKLISIFWTYKARGGTMKHFKLLFLVFAASVALAIVFPTSSPAPETITVSLDKQKEVVKKTDGVKFRGEIDGLESDKSYIIRIQIYEDGGAAYSAPLLQSFTVE